MIGMVAGDIQTLDKLVSWQHKSPQKTGSQKPERK
jgi:hypothetical protein